MSVVIKGMDKPKNCFGCDFNMYDCYCKINHGEIDKDFWFCDKTCPIVEVPEPYGEHLCEDEVVSCLEGADWINDVIRIFLNLQAEETE